MKILQIKLIFKKVISLTASSLKDTNFGSITNIIANGLNSIENKMIYLSYVFLAPIVIGVCTYLLWLRFGYFCLIGIFATLIQYPIYHFINVITGKLIPIKNGFVDKIINLCKDLILNNRVIKMYSWQNSLVNLVNFVRKKETAYITLISCVNFI